MRRGYDFWAGFSPLGLGTCQGLTDNGPGFDPPPQPTPATVRLPRAPPDRARSLCLSRSQELIPMGIHPPWGVDSYQVFETPAGQVFFDISLFMDDVFWEVFPLHCRLVISMASREAWRQDVVPEFVDFQIIRLITSIPLICLHSPFSFPFVTSYVCIC